MEKILIIGPYNDDVRAMMKENLSRDFEVIMVTEQEKILEHLDADYVILRTLKLPNETIARMPNLKFIQRWGAGVDIIGVEEATKRGIPVANIAGENAPAVAELTLMMMLSVYRNILRINATMHEGRWIKNSIDKQCYMINDKKVGVIGLGNIGSLVAKYVTALGAEVLYYDIERKPAAEEALGARFMELDELLKQADIVTLHVPLNDSTRYLIGEKEVALMKPTAMLINCARGCVVEERAVAQALAEHRLLGAGFDCFESEPPAPDSAILSRPEVVVSCHVGGNTADIAYRLARRCPQNIRDFCAGKLESRFVVNKEVLS